MEKEITKDLSYPFVSVIVPVYNDSQRIEKCIEALLNQTYPSEQYEVLVIDNSSTDETCTVIKKYPVKLLIENTIQSSYAARNKGIKNAQGEVIAFTDSDCIPSSDWVEKGVANLLSVPNCGLVAGRINIFFRDPDKPNAVELYDSIMGFNQREDIERRHFGSTANVFTFKRVFDKVGLFNDELKSGGDNEWGRRVFSYGYSQIYADDTIVFHPIRNSFTQLYIRTVRLVGGCYDQYWRNSYSFAKFSGDLIKSIKNIMALAIGITFNIFYDKELKNIKQKMQFILVGSCVEMFRILEKFRLLLGGVPKR
jgi:glycosyltransferase involved in cell wall biosynthesis